MSDEGEIRHVSRKEDLKEKARTRRRELYQKLKEKTKDRRKAAYERQKARYKEIQAKKKTAAKEAKAEARRDLLKQRDEELLQALMPADRVKPKLRLVQPLADSPDESR